MTRIRLVGTNNLPGVSGHDGHVIEVTDDNQDSVETLILHGSARLLKEPAEKIVTTTGPQLEKMPIDQLPKGVLDASEGKLTAASAVGDIANSGIHARYIKALTDAGCVTVSDVLDRSATLSETPGISVKAAEQILAALEEAGV